MRGRSVTSADHAMAMLGTTVSAHADTWARHTHTDARHAHAHTRSQNAPDTERTIRMCLLCSFIFQRANNTWRNTASFNQISDDNLRQVSMRLRTRTKLNEKRRTDKVQREKRSKHKNNRRKTQRKNKNSETKQCVFAICRHWRGRVFLCFPFFVHHDFSFFSHTSAVLPRRPSAVPPAPLPASLPSHAATVTAPSATTSSSVTSDISSSSCPSSSISSSSSSELKTTCHHLSLRGCLPLSLEPLLSLRRRCLTHCHGRCLTHRHCRCLTRPRLSSSLLHPPQLLVRCTLVAQ